MPIRRALSSLDSRCGHSLLERDWLEKALQTPAFSLSMRLAVPALSAIWNLSGWTVLRCERTRWLDISVFALHWLLSPCQDKVEWIE